jgi:hypothetical protein
MIEFKAGTKVRLLYFPGVEGIVEGVDGRGRVWVVLNKDVLDTKANEPSPISVWEMEPVEGD